MTEAVHLSLHSGSCVRCGTTEDLIAVSEFGKALCARCYPGFLRHRIEATIRRFRMVPHGGHAVLAVSGGADSGTLLDALGYLRRRLNFTLTALHLDMGMGEYSAGCVEVVREQARKACVSLQVNSVREFGVTVTPVREWPICSVCGAVRRALLPRIARSLRADVLCTGHTLDDQLQYMLKNVISGHPTCPPPVHKPTLGYPAKAKPLIQIPDAATKIYAQLMGIPLMEDPCPLFVPETHRFKEVFDLLEKAAPMGKLQYWQVLRKVMEPRGDDEDGAEHPCPVCGELTWMPKCPLCRLKEEQARSDPRQAPQD